MIKKISIIACLMLGVITAQAQHKVISFFDEMGSARIQTEEFSQAHDTIVKVVQTELPALFPNQVGRRGLS